MFDFVRESWFQILSHIIIERIVFDGLVYTSNMQQIL